MERCLVLLGRGGAINFLVCLPEEVVVEMVVAT